MSEGRNRRSRGIVGSFREKPKCAEGVLGRVQVASGNVLGLLYNVECLSEVYHHKFEVQSTCRGT